MKVQHFFSLQHERGSCDKKESCPVFFFSSYFLHVSLVLINKMKKKKYKVIFFFQFFLLSQFCLTQLLNISSAFELSSLSRTVKRILNDALLLVVVVQHTRLGYSIPPLIYSYVYKKGVRQIRSSSLYIFVGDDRPKVFSVIKRENSFFSFLAELFFSVND